MKYTLQRYYTHLKSLSKGIMLKILPIILLPNLGRYVSFLVLDYILAG